MASQTGAVCSGCAGLSAEAPVAILNAPGRSMIAARAGQWASYRNTMLALLSSSALGRLADLKVRNDDVAVALIDAWASMGHVASFYAERLTSEMLLATAEEPLSLRELARLPGYRPSPGVAAGATLAFTLATGPGTPAIVPIPAGAKAMSTPGPDEAPVTFETSHAIEARTAWQAIRPKLARRQPLGANTRRVRVPGLASNLKAGDALWYRTDAGTEVLALVRMVTPIPADKGADPDAADTTEVVMERYGSAPVSDASAPPAWPAAAMPATGLAASVIGQTLSAADVTALLEQGAHAEGDLFGPWLALAAPPAHVLHLGQRAAIFGHNAPALATLPEALIGDVVTFSVVDGVVTATGIKAGPFKGLGPEDWADAGRLSLFAGTDNSIYLESPQQAIASDSHIAIRAGGLWVLHRVATATEQSVSQFTLSGRTSRLDLADDAGLSVFPIRNATVHGNSQILALAQRPRTDPVAGGGYAWVALDGFVPGLQPGMPMIATGPVEGGAGEVVSERVELADVRHLFVAGGGTEVRFTTNLRNRFIRSRLRLNANVAAATHGERVSETLGNGDARLPFQSFRTRQGPLTHTTADVPGGALSSLDVRINGQRWQEVPDLLASKPADRHFVTRIDTEGHAIIGFGDGATGARLPTGTSNVTASYRKGLGLAGRVRAGQLNQPMTRPLGLSAVLNPLPAEGGADPESMAAIRQSVALTVRTLGRTVSLLDYADEAAAFAGIAKAEAVAVTDRFGDAVAVTVALDGGAPLPEPSAMRSALGASLASLGDPYARHLLLDHRRVLFCLGLLVKPDPDTDAASVLAAVESGLRAGFGFDARRFTQPVVASEILASVHAISGVLAAHITALHRSGDAGLNVRLPAQPAVATRSGFLGAELLTLDPGPMLALELMA